MFSSPSQCVVIDILKPVLMSQLSYCKHVHERASSWPTPVLDGCSSANFTFIATCTWTKLLRDETLLLDGRCPAVLTGVLGSLSMRSFSATRTPDWTRSQPHWLHSFPGKPLLALSQLLQTSLVTSHTDFTRSQAGLADTYAGTHVRTHTRTHARKCSRHHDPLGLAQARPN